MSYNAQTLTQNQRILNHLKRGKPITSLQALHLFQCFRLATRIWELKRDGYNIISTMIVTPYSKKRIASYSLDKQFRIL